MTGWYHQWNGHKIGKPLGDLRNRKAKEISNRLRDALNRGKNVQ